MNGFDEFFGNLYHLNAEEEPELPDYPKDPAYLAKFGPRGVLKCKATDRDDPTVDPRFGKIGKQTIEDTGALTKKRMETIDDETSSAAIDFMKRQQAAGKPFFCWFNATRMHLRTHVRAAIVAAIPMATANTSMACSSMTTRSVACSRRWTTWASPTTPSSSTPATTGRT